MNPSSHPEAERRYNIFIDSLKGTILSQSDNASTTTTSTTSNLNVLYTPELFITNHYVLENVTQAKESLTASNYEIDLHGQRLRTERFRLRPDQLSISSPKEELDFTIVVIDGNSELRRFELLVSREE